MSESSGRNGSERGASLVEFAFVLPIMLAFVMGLVTYGLTEAGDNTASSAAREGARVGILQYEDADDDGSDDGTPSAAYTAIVEAANRHLDSGFVSQAEVAVRCVKPGSGGSIPSPSAADSCASTDVVRGRDLIEVTVTWDPIGPVERPRREELARMTIVGRPELGDTDAPAPIDNDPNDEIPIEYQPDETETETETETEIECVITAITLSPEKVPVKNHGDLHKSVVYRAETNGGANCGEITFHWPPNSHDVETTVLTPRPEDGAYIGALPAGSGNWTIATNRSVRAVAANGAELTLLFDAVPHSNGGN